MTNNGVSFRGRLFSNLRYADDTALVETNFVKSSEIINEEGENADLRLNATKTKILHIGGDTDETITIEGEDLERSSTSNISVPSKVQMEGVKKTSNAESVWQNSAC